MQVAIQDFDLRFGSGTPLPLFALALSDAAATLGVRVVLRKVTSTKHYWSGRAGRMFLLCLSPGLGQGGFGEAQRSVVSPGCLLVDRGFREAFATPNMTPRYR